MYYKDFIRKIFEFKNTLDVNKSLDELLNEYIDDIVYMLSKHVENKYINDNGDIIVEEIKFDKGIVSFKLAKGVKSGDVINDKNFIEFLKQLIAEASNSFLTLDKLYSVSNRIIVLKFKKFDKSNNNG